MSGFIPSFRNPLEKENGALPVPKTRMMFDVSALPWIGVGTALEGLTERTNISMKSKRTNVFVTTDARPECTGNPATQQVLRIRSNLPAATGSAPFSSNCQGKTKTVRCPEPPQGDARCVVATC